LLQEDPPVRRFDAGATTWLARPSLALPEIPTGAPAPRTDEHDRRRTAAGVLVDVFDAVALVAGVVAGVGLDGEPLWVALLLAVVVAGPLTAGGDWTPSRLTLSAMDELPRIVGCVGAALLVLAPFGLAADAAGGVLLQAAVTAGSLVVARALSYGVIRRARRRGALVDRAVVVGAGAVGMEIERILRTHPEYGVRVVGFVDRGAPSEGFSRTEVPEVVADVAQLEELLGEHAVRRVIVAFGRCPEHELVDVLRRLALLDAEVHVVPRFFDIGVAPAVPRVDDLRGIPLYHAPRAGRRRRSWGVKRLLDVVLSATFLFLVLPVLAVLALAVRASGPGGALFRQQRTGHDGREFRLLKLRSLRAGPSPDEGMGAVPTEVIDDLQVQALRRRDVESRRTAVGELVRRTSLDELPQLWNVLRGDMSLVGPRPEEVAFARWFSESVPGYRSRHRLPMGLTGWAQVNGLRGQTSIAERARFDNHYIEHWSLWRDVVILLRTGAAVCRSILGRFDGQPAVDAARKDG
jgi:exopolysaccharide biosynthesis polyprenyl glycosylphosphotransferase